MAKNWAICIGVNKYENLPALRFAVRDAECMKEWFENEAGFKKVYLFTDNSPEIINLALAFKKRFMKNYAEPQAIMKGDGLASVMRLAGENQEIC